MPSSDLQAQIAEIQTALLERCDALGARTADAVWREVDYYGGTGQIGLEAIAPMPDDAAPARLACGLVAPVP